MKVDSAGRGENMSIIGMTVSIAARKKNGDSEHSRKTKNGKSGILKPIQKPSIKQMIDGSIFDG